MRNATFSVFSPLQLGICHLQPLCIRLFCSSTSQETRQSTRHDHELSPLCRKPATELSIPSLVDMGFTDTQAEQIFDAMSKFRGGSAAKHALSTLTALFVLGLNPSSVLKLLEKCPELYTVKESQLQQRIGNLRKLGLVEGEAVKADSDSDLYAPQLIIILLKHCFRGKYFKLRVHSMNDYKTSVFPYIPL